MLICVVTLTSAMYLGKVGKFVTSNAIIKL